MDEITTHPTSSIINLQASVPMLLFFPKLLFYFYFPHSLTSKAKYPHNNTKELIYAWSSPTKINIWYLWLSMLSMRYGTYQHDEGIPRQRNIPHDRWPRKKKCIGRVGRAIITIIKISHWKQKMSFPNPIYNWEP